VSIADHMVYGLLWLSFGIVHSLLAGETAKRRLRPWLGGGYRLAYNGFAALHLALIWLGGRALVGSDPADLGLPEAAQTVLTVLRWAGLLIIVAGLLHYDLGRFSGLTQLFSATRGRPGSEDEALHVTGLHRYLRHPLYAGAYLYLWGGVGNDFQLATAVWASAYLAIGARLEENRLVVLYGASYQEYRERVPSLIPWRGRAY
jgi:protein-S-isoprenylcysteine O-methyltransferase Ste14